MVIVMVTGPDTVARAADVSLAPPLGFAVESGLPPVIVLVEVIGMITNEVRVVVLCRVKVVVLES